MFIIWNTFSIDTWDCWEDWLIILFKISLGHKLINFYLTIFTMVVGLHFNRYKISATCKCFYWGNASWYLKLETIISQFWPYGISYILNNYTWNLVISNYQLHKIFSLIAQNVYLQFWLLYLMISAINMISSIICLLFRLKNHRNYVFVFCYLDSIVVYPFDSPILSWNKFWNFI